MWLQDRWRTELVDRHRFHFRGNDSVLLLGAYLPSHAITILVVGEQDGDTLHSSGQLSRAMLSSRWTCFVKYIFGPLWIVLFGLGALGAVFAVHGASERGAGAPPPGFEWIFVAVWIIASAGILRFALPLKRVELRDDRLFVSNYFREWEIAPGDIVSVRQNRWVNARPIRVELRHSVEGLGSRFLFIPPSRILFKFWQDDPEVDELRQFAETVHAGPKA
jgi:hypothetical protein